MDFRVNEKSIKRELIENETYNLQPINIKHEIIIEDSEKNESHNFNIADTQLKPAQINNCENNDKYEMEPKAKKKKTTTTTESALQLDNYFDNLETEEEKKYIQENKRKNRNLHSVNNDSVIKKENLIENGIGEGPSSNIDVAATPVMMQNLKKIEEVVKFNELSAKVDNLTTKVNLVLKEISKISGFLKHLIPHNQIQTLDDDKSIEFDFPLKTVSEMNEFNEKLKNREINEKMVKYLTIIGGIQENPFKFATDIANKLFSVDLINKFSWTGKSGTKDIRKIPFCNLLEILNLFLKVVRTITPSYTELQNKQFFIYNLLKYSSHKIKIQSTNVGMHSNE